MGETVAIVGSREFHPLALVRLYVERLPRDTVVVSGGASGVDAYAEQIARARELPVEVLRPNWQRYGRRAGAVRNEQIVERADRVVAFWNGTSPGTRITIDLARRMGKPCEIIPAPPAPPPDDARGQP